MTLSHDIGQRDLRMRSREIMDAVERGETFTVTRGGRDIAELVPLRRRRVFLTREEFVALGRGLSSVDADHFRRDIDDIVTPYADDPYER